MSIDDAKTASRMKLRNRMVIHQRDILQFIPKKSWFETCTSGFKIWHVVLLIYLKFRGLWNLPMQRLAKIWETVPSFSLAKGEFFLRGWKLSTQRKGSMYEARCRLKFVAKCRLVSSFFFHFYGARCDGLSNYVQTCWNWDVFQDLVCWHWFWKKNIFRCQMVQPLFLRIQPCFPSDPTVFSSRFSCRCPIPAFLGKSRGENTFWRLTKRRGRRSKESDRKEEESGNGPSEITYFSDIEI